MSQTKGIDISHWNSWENPEAAWEAGARFIIVRIGSINNLTGICYTDYDLENNMSLLKEWNENNPDKILAVGVYFFGRLNHDVHKQAQFIADTVKYCEEDLGVKVGVVVWDHEVYGSASLLKAGVEETALFTGKETGIYTSPNIWNTMTPGDKSWASNFFLWIAQWTSASSPMELEPWKSAEIDWTFWQFSAENNGLGVTFGAAPPPYGDHDMDINWFNGEYSDVLNFFNYIEEEPEPVEKLGTIYIEKPGRYSGIHVRSDARWGQDFIIGQLKDKARVTIIGEKISGNGELFYILKVFVPEDMVILDEENT